ncbi:nitroreductase family deazaflavin-dependent oxidoreductase [Mycobacterium sp. WMMD1722]|uniref:nitroreductase family deazaflavin-dependent oxidoreductase n=1 Tax=Mycobacterium sp. WMMD1722 TaxID=3404117 RepID=UPI003BF614AA
MATDRDVLDDVNRKVVEEFRANGGKVGGPFEGSDLVLLTTVGARSGQPRISPLVYFDIDGRILIAGSFGGSPKAPAWVHNLRARPEVRVEIGDDSYDARARELPHDERDALYPRVVEKAPQFGEYQSKTTRVIPLFELVRA